MIISELKKSLREFSIQNGDVLCVSSDITSFGIPKEIRPRMKEKGPTFLLSSYIDTFKDAVGSGGLLLMPTFSYRETRGDVFDVRNTETTVGVLPEYFRKQKGVKRSLHPIFSFAVWGAGAEKFAALESFDCFGEKSMFGKLRKANALYLSFGVDMQNSSTYIFHSEQRAKVHYRTFRVFRETVIDEQGVKRVKIVRYFTRKKELGYRAYWHGLEKKALEKGVTQSALFNGGRILGLRSREIDKLIQKELAQNAHFLITRV